ncbi:MAG: hypothetical protein HZB51_04755 [Chloroflexi bacterium]|nr:hypothetical protein [Chloroflexota bacterium]
MEQPIDNQPQDVVQIMAQIREQWQGVINAMVAACNGNTEAAAQLVPFLDQMYQKEDWRPLINTLRRILNGEREPEALLANIDDTDMLIVTDILRALGVDPRALPTLPGDEPDDDDGEMLSLQDFLGLVTQACKPDAPPGLKEQLQNATQGMLVQPDNPPELKQLARVLQAILAGDRNPDLLTLDPQLIGPVRQILDDLK